jgi:phosphoglycerate dehydrogenase-like enzyme
MVMTEAIRLLLADGVSGKITRKVQESPDATAFKLIIPENNSEAALIAAAPQADAILCYQTPVPGSVIRAAGALKLIQKHGLNCRGIDVETATRQKVKVGTTALLRSVSVAEHAMALMLACARKIVAGHHAVTQAVYQKMGLEPVATSELSYRPNWAKVQDMREVFGSTVGIVGMGDIGMEIAKRCRAFGMTIRYNQRSPHSAATEQAMGARFLPLDELMSVSDYLILVLPHTPESEGMIGTAALARMKPTATLINVGRGGLIDEAALLAALQRNPHFMAGLDVYRNEPLPASSPLLSLPNVVLLPHLGGGSYRSAEVDTPASLRNIRRFFAGEAVDGIVNY